MFRTINQAFIASALIIAAATGITIAIVPEKWVFVPVIGLGVSIALLAILWKWQTRPYAGEIQRIMNGGSLITKAFLLLGSLFVQTVAVMSMCLTYLQVHERIPICLSAQCGRDYIDLILIAAAGGGLEIVGACASILAIFGIVGRNRQSFNQ